MNGSRERGLSLLELLVVFVIISMVSTAIVQGFGFGLSLYERVQAKSQQHAVDLLSAKWFRLVNQALIPGKTVERSLVGAADGFSAVTVNPLVSQSGTPEVISWRVEEGFLFYTEGENRFSVARVAQDASFEYRNPRGEWVRDWPFNEQQPSLPLAIRLIQENQTITVAVKGKLTPNLLLEESRRER